MKSPKPNFTPPKKTYMGSGSLLLRVCSRTTIKQQNYARHITDVFLVEFKQVLTYEGIDLRHEANTKRPKKKKKKGGYLKLVQI